MTNRNESSTRFDRVFINSDLADDAIEVWLNADTMKEAKIAPGICRTALPDGSYKTINHQPIHIQLSEIH